MTRSVEPPPEAPVCRKLGRANLLEAFPAILEQAEKTSPAVFGARRETLGHRARHIIARRATSGHRVRHIIAR